MSIQWTLVAFILYVEIAIVVLLLLPFLRPRTWQKFFKSRFLRSIENSMREMVKYAGDLNVDHSGSRHVDAELQHSMKLFRAQRNFYIAGFALFLFLVIRRLVTLITELSQLGIQAEAAMKQASSASEAAKSLIDKSKGGDESKELKELKKLVEEKTNEVKKANINVEALKKQTENLTEEYDRLMKEHQNFVKKQKKVDGDNKKDS